MKTIHKNIREKSLNKKLSVFVFLTSLFILSSCDIDVFVEDGRPGDAYFALTWTEDEPDYVDAGTNAIPSVFYWNDYYYIRPGIYVLYYDGIYNDGYGYIDYAWEIEYEIYINPGEKGSIYYGDGGDGEDNYFSLDCNPYGPYVYLDYKSSPAEQSFKVLEKTEDKIIIKKENTNYSLKATYTKVSKRTHE